MLIIIAYWGGFQLPLKTLDHPINRCNGTQESSVRGSGDRGERFEDTGLELPPMVGGDLLGTAEKSNPDSD
jgi:hypothetical protein